MDTEASMLWAILFGAIGSGFFIYGTRQRAAVPFAVGVALGIFPYFVTNVYLMVVVGVGLIAIPYFIRL
ncbi:MAG: hypothetical protein HY080_05720 [Gammaproteobacteria bacterium]|nr:hypothetical protein [Gammaproteobacteria bacterium]